LSLDQPDEHDLTLRGSTGIRCNDILRELLADGIWHWTYDNGTDNHVPILNDLRRHVDNGAMVVDNPGNLQANFLW
jgi:hypothetical protein